jgi:hypothetical protein
MATYHERAQIASDPVFVIRCRQAAVKYAVYISGNPATDAKNVRLLKSVLAAPDAFAALFATAVSEIDFTGGGTADDASIDSAAGDVALSAQIESSIWPAFAREV